MRLDSQQQAAKAALTPAVAAMAPPLAGAAADSVTQAPSCSLPPPRCVADTMPWQLPGELAGRVQRARRLLAESEAHAGSADLQASSTPGCMGFGSLPVMHAAPACPSKLCGAVCSER